MEINSLIFSYLSNWHRHFHKIFSALLQMYFIFEAFLKICWSPWIWGRIEQKQCILLHIYGYLCSAADEIYHLDCTYGIGKYFPMAFSSDEYELNFTVALNMNVICLNVYVYYCCSNFKLICCQNIICKFRPFRTYYYSSSMFSAQINNIWCLWKISNSLQRKLNPSENIFSNTISYENLTCTLSF